MHENQIIDTISKLKEALSPLNIYGIVGIYICNQIIKSRKTHFAYYEIIHVYEKSKIFTKKQKSDSEFDIDVELSKIDFSGISDKSFTPDEIQSAKECIKAINRKIKEVHATISISTLKIGGLYLKVDDKQFSFDDEQVNKTLMVGNYQTQSEREEEGEREESEKEKDSTQIFDALPSKTRAKIRYSNKKEEGDIGKENSLTSRRVLRQLDERTSILRNPDLPDDLIATLTLIEEDNVTSVRINKYYTLIGRNEEEVDIVIEGDTTVSRRHFKISYKKPEFILEDLGSSNYTYINEKCVKKEPLDNEDIIKIGNVSLRFNIKKIEKKTYEDVEKAAPEKTTFFKSLKKFIKDHI